MSVPFRFAAHDFETLRQAHIVFDSSSPLPLGLPRFQYFSQVRGLFMSESSRHELREESKSLRQPSRREFARGAAFAATIAVIAPSALLSQQSTPKSATPSADKPPQAPSELSPELQAEGELKYQWIVQTYGSRLTDAQKKDVHRLVMEGQKPLAAFRAFQLDNADQPATVLKFTDAELAASGSGR
jgi:hypothetical protein